MLINNEFEIGYLVVVFALLGVILIGALLTALHLDRWHPKLISAVVGALLGLALIEAVPILT
ncbi:membrane protein [Caballeronia peredens]|nr:membrane protein [Caballeronia peredens]